MGNRVRPGRSVVRAAAVAMTIAGPLGRASVMATAGPPDLLADGCPVLYAIGVQGTGQSDPSAPPTADTGMLSELFSPMVAEAGAAHVKVARVYIPYEASFGGLDGGSDPDTEPYAQSVQDSLKALRRTLGQIGSSCPATQFALAGYSQGAHIVSMYAQGVGTGSEEIPASRIAAVALFGDPVHLYQHPIGVLHNSFHH